MASYQEYLSRNTVGGYLKKKRLEQQIGLDTYSADLKALSDSIAEGGIAFGSAEGFDSARQSAEALLGRTKALQEYVKLYGGDSTGLAETSEWLTGQKDYFGRFADFADYQGQKAEYERLSQNYDFAATEAQIAKLREQRAGINGFEAAADHLLGWHEFGDGVNDYQLREDLDAQIAALEKEMQTARVYAAKNAESLENFGQLSQFVTSNPNGVSFQDGGGGSSIDWLHEYINNGFDQSAGSWHSYAARSEYAEPISDLAINEVWLDVLTHLNESEKAQYNYIHNEYGAEASMQYLNGMYDTLYSRYLGQEAEYASNHPFLGTLKSLGHSVLSSGEELGRVLSDQTDQYNASADIANALQSGVVQNIESDVGAFFYNTGVSALQSVATGILFGNAGGVVLGLSAMASTRNDLLRRGADAETATKAGLAAGIFECLFESVSLGQLTAFKDVSVDSFKDLVLNFAKGSFVNASEEMATEIANILYDTFANGDFSEAQQMLDAGMSKGEIAKKYWAQIGEAAASGAVMGLGFGALGSGASGVSNAVNASRIGKAVKSGETTFGSVSGLTELGEKYGIKQTAKVKAKGTKASNRAVGGLYRRVHAAVAQENKGTTKTAIERRLTDLGADKAKAGKLADVVLKKYMRESLSFKESALLDGSKVARQALNEMLEDANSKWINDLKATLEGEVSRDITTIGEEERAAAAEQAAGIARSEGAEVQVAASGEALGALPQIASVGANGVTLAAPTGEVALNDAAMTEDKAMLYTLAGLLPSADIANEFVAAWDGVTDPDAYFGAFQMIYTYGRNHTGYSDEQITEAGKKSGLGEAQIAAAFKSGVKSLAEERRIEREHLDGIIQKFRESGANRPEGKWDAAGLRGVDLKKVAKENAGLQDIEQFVAFLRMTTKAFGWNVRVIADNAEGHSNGGYNPATNTLTFNIYSGTMIGTELVRTAMPNTISHETVHWMKRNAPEQYQALEDMVLAALKNANDYDFGEAVKKEYGKYKEKHGQDIDDPTAREEIVARACEDLFGRSEKIQQFLADFAEKNKEAATGFTAAVKKVLAKIKEFFENLMFGHSSRTLEAGIIRKCGADVVQGLQEQYDKTFFAALEGNAARNATGEFEQGGVRFSDGLTRTKSENMHVKDDKGLKSDPEDDADYVEYNKPITIKDVGILRSIGRKSVNAFTSEEIKKAQKWAYKFYQELGVKSPFFRAWFGDWREYDKTPVRVASIAPLSNDKIQRNEQIKRQKGEVICDDTTLENRQGWSVRISREGIENTKSHAGEGKLSVEGLSNISGLLENAILLDTEVHEHHDNNAKDDRIAFDHKLYALGQNPDGTISLYKITVEDTFQDSNHPNDLRFHNLRYVTEIKKVVDHIGSLTDESKARRAESTSDVSTTTYSISDLFGFVKQYDTEFSPKPVHEALIDKKTGLPKVFYHGTNAEFTSFDLSKSGAMFGAVSEGMFFFTDKKEKYPGSARDYAQHAVREKGGKERVVECYLSMRNPLVIDSSRSYDPIAHYDKNAEKIYQQYFNGDYDGIIIYDFSGKKSSSVLAITDNAAQIKSATDNIGTYDGGNDNMLYSDPEDDVKSDREILAGALLDYGWNAFAEVIGKKLTAEDLAELRWQIENIAKIEEDSKRLNADVDEAQESALIETIVNQIKSHTEKPKIEKTAFDNSQNSPQGTSRKELVDATKSVDGEDDVKSDREILAGALMSVAQNEIERNALKVYQGYAKKLDEMNKRLREVNAEIRTMMFQRGARDEAYTKRLDELKAEKDKLEKGIAKWDSKLFALEVTKSLQDLLDREKQRTAKLWIDAGRKAMNNYREKQLCRVYTQKIEEKAKNLRKMLLENSEKYHIPDAFKKPVAAFLSLLDFSSERALQGGELTKKDMELQAAFAEVETLLQALTDENSSEYLTGLDLPPDAVEEFVALSKEVAQMAIDGREGDTMVLRRMSSEQLKTLNTTLYAMTRAVRQANDLFANERFRHVSDLALDFIGNSEQYAAREKQSKISDFLSWENMVPYYAFKRLGAAGEALFKGFMQGQDTFAFLVKEIIDFTDKLYTEEEVKAWSKEVHTFDGTNGKVYITTAQIMSLYELWKDKDARQHILGGGGRIQDISFGVKNKYTNDPNGTTLGELMVDAMFAKLTPRQKAVADSLQKFMADECAKWGNEVSYKRWGIRIFGLDYYFPIESDKNTVAADVEQRAKENGLFSLLHKSFTKKRVFNANNRIMIRSVFDVFASHTTDMAKYRAFALPLLDMQKFINFKEIVRPEGEGEVTTELPAEGEQKDTSFTTKEVRASMEKAFGTAAYKYIEQFLIDLNGNIGGRSAAESILQKGITLHKIAAVGANLRVALLQPTAYMRLLNVMEPKYFFGGLAAGGHLKSCIEKMQKYAGIALWKSLGYRDTNIAAPIQTKIKHDETWRDKVTEKSMILAELGDKVTWGAIWYACELETRDKHKDLKIGSEEYYRAVAERFTEAIYATQVVDSTFTKSQIMRKKDFFSTLFTSFMSEPTLSYNLLASNALSLSDIKRRGGKITKAAAKPLVRAIGTFAIGALLQAGVESLIDAARGADDEEKYGERYWEEFLANSIQEIVPLNLIPVVKDIWSIALATIKGDYMQSSRMDLEVYHRISRAVKAVGKMFEDGEVAYSAIYKILTALSSMTGLPISNLVRDVVAIWNVFVSDIGGGQPIK